MTRARWQALGGPRDLNLLRTPTQCAHVGLWRVALCSPLRPCPSSALLSTRIKSHVGLSIVYALILHTSLWGFLSLFQVAIFISYLEVTYGCRL